MKMNILIFGPPGIGKGTVSGLLTKKLGIPHIATGDILREEAKKPGNRMKQYMEKGLLVPDDIVSEIVAERLEEEDCKNGFILDGYPRTLNQVKFLKKKSIAVDRLINMQAGIEVIVERLSGRMVCKKCNTIYHKKNMPPKKEGICDKCGSPLIQRADDSPDVIKKRISVYSKDTEPIIDYYEKKGIVRKVDGSKSLNDVLDSIFAAI